MFGDDETPTSFDDLEICQGEEILDVTKWKPVLQF
jgi:hypothetical protein